MIKNNNVVRRIGLVSALVLALTGVGASAANAGGGSMNCSGAGSGGVSSFVPIVNGNSGNGSWAQTNNTTGACGTVSHLARVVQYGSPVTVSRGGYDSSNKIVSRDFFGTMMYSHHYHNGNAYSKLNY